MNVFPSLDITGRKNPSGSTIHPFKSCPSSNHPFSLKMIASFPAHSRMQGARFCGKRSKADKCIGTNALIASPSITPWPRKPRETPSVPCAIILVPAMRKTWMFISTFNDRACNRTTNPRSFSEDDDPRDTQASTVELSVNIHTSAFLKSIEQQSPPPLI